ncbi:MAG TPA: GDP-mannose 4,6-dehydratase [Anaerolineales bacterium]|nr:GDP-mannose 4,6-dehydratase [Anaerolineales bacterium]
MPLKRALITGITGQDGSYLAELLLEKGYEVHGVVRRVAIEDPQNRLWRIRHLVDRIHLHTASLDSLAGLERAVEASQPDECYHLAAESFVSYSFEGDLSTISLNINGAIAVLSALRNLAPRCRFYFAGSSEMFGNAAETPQTEGTPFHPRSPYGISKVAGVHLTRSYREAHGLFAVVGILYNHESERRGPEFVTRKISSSVARIKLGLAESLTLGNLEARRDWGYAPEYVGAIWQMMQRDTPDEFLIATGVSHSVREFVEKAFAVVGLPWQDYLRTDERFFRANESVELRGNPGKARSLLGWSPTVSFDQIVERMVEADLERLAFRGGRRGFWDG